MRKIKVVIVEDEPAIVRSIQKLIEKFSALYCVCGTAFNGQDGLEMILEIKPDIVFTDIRMPFFSGLEMIEAVQKKGMTNRFVILSGYAEFDYARKAMELGVSDYLLKPINPIEMKKLLDKMERSFFESCQRAQEEYMTQMIAFHKENPEIENPFISCDCYLLFSYYGSMANQNYEELGTGRETVRCMRDEWILELQNKYGVCIFSLKGFKANEIMYVVTYESDKTIDIHLLVEEVWGNIQTDSTYVNLIVSEKITKGCRLAEAVRNSRLFAAYTMPFGKGKCFWYKEIYAHKKIAVSDFAIQQCRKIGEYGNISYIKKNVSEIVNFWEAAEVSQIQLQTDLRYYMNCYFALKRSDKDYPVAGEEIMAASNSYKELENNIVLELFQLLQLQEQDNDSSSRAYIVYQMKEFLDENYSSPLSGRELSDRFGYNENYLSTLFKAEFGITPSRYISELRIKLAKRLMTENPDILLKNVAVRTGYGDALYFSRVFRNREGITPSRFLENIRQKS